MVFDFDQPLNREGSLSTKVDGRGQYFGTDDVLPMWVADMDFAVPPCVSEALEARAAHPVFGYSFYPESLYQAIIDWFARRYHWTVERDWIMMAPGVVPSLHAIAQALAGEGEGIIVQPPVYFPFFSAVTQTRRKLLLNPLREYQGHYEMDLAHLEQLAPGARLLFLCSPHNPVGRVWRKEELEQVLCIARRHDLIIVSDDIHADLTYPGIHHQLLATLGAEFADYLHSHLITAIAPSKTFNIPGLGLSSLVVPNAEHRRLIQQVFTRTHLGNHNPFSILACEAAYRGGDAWLDALRTYLLDNKNLVRDTVQSRLPQLRWIEPEGTYLVWLDCRELGLSDTALRDFFVQRCRLGLNPGRLFGEEGSGFMRMNIGTQRARVKEALSRLEAGLASR